MAKKKGRHKKEILETIDLEDWKKFQSTLKKNLEYLGGEKNLSPSEKKFLDEYLVRDGDDDYEKTLKALRFKRYILKKCLTQDECTYFIDVDSKGTKPSRERRLSKMSVCKIEAKALAKLREALGSKFNIFSLGDVLDHGRSHVPGEPVDFSQKGREL